MVAVVVTLHALVGGIVFTRKHCGNLKCLRECFKDLSYRHEISVFIPAAFEARLPLALPAAPYDPALVCEEIAYARPASDAPNAPAAGPLGQPWPDLHGNLPGGRAGSNVDPMPANASVGKYVILPPPYKRKPTPAEAGGGVVIRIASGRLLLRRAVRNKERLLRRRGHPRRRRQGKKRRRSACGRIKFCESQTFAMKTR